MSFFTVAIVGRPNVGKSSLFNRVVGRMVSIVEDVHGVTRDRILQTVTWEDKEFDLIDTGGIGIVDEEIVAENVELQIETAISQADLVVFMSDGQQGITSLDRDIAQRLRKLNMPIIFVVNKCDNTTLEENAVEFCELGLGEPLAISVTHRFGISELMDRIAEHVPEREDEEPEEEIGALKLALVGRRNAGKSSIVNFLAGEERVIVCDHAGTTRDSVDVVFEWEKEKYVAIDTAGFRKKKQLKDSIEFFSMCRAERSIRRCDVAIFVVDATVEISIVEKKLAEYLMAEAHPIVIAVNKWDLTTDDINLTAYKKYLEKKLPGTSFVPMIGISAKTGYNVPQLMKIVNELAEQAEQRITTGRLNRAVEVAKTIKRPRTKKPSENPKIYYASQVSTKPPTIVVFVNDVKLFDDEYRRYMAKFFRENLGLPEIPIKILFRGREKTDVSESQVIKRKKHQYAKTRKPWQQEP